MYSANKWLQRLFLLITLYYSLASSGLLDDKLNQLKKLIKLRPVPSKIDYTYDPTLAVKYAWYSNIAYCEPYDLVVWNCAMCQHVKNFYPFSYPYNDSTDVHSFIGIENITGTPLNIILSFRGTNPASLEDWIIDLNFPFNSPYSNTTYVEVHEGFLQAYYSVKPQITFALITLMKMYPTATLAITGHSLGAALAELCAIDLILDKFWNNTITLYTYGQPRIGNMPFALLFDYYISNAFRVIHYADLVPHVPVMEQGFWHTAREVWYTEDFSSYTICNSSGEDPLCSDSLWFPDSIPDHLNYFGISMGAGNCSLV